MLPIEELADTFSEIVHSKDIVLIAPPGAGKSTFIPKLLLKLSFLQHQKIIMLQPRRVAARSIASFLAESIGEKVGQTIGYKIKGESKESVNTRLLVVTEGLLSRMLQNDPELSDVGCIIFDEFHERSVHLDLALAFCLDVKESIREDLRIVLMSATLDKQIAEQLLPDAQLLESKGKSFPVEILYRPDHSKQRNKLLHVNHIIHEAVNYADGDILCFLPGIADIKKLQVSLQQGISDSIEIHVLHSSVSSKAQTLATTPSYTGARKIILSTNIAETSLTINGVSIVIDTGKEKVSGFNFAKGLSTLQTKMISSASSIQRAGRAGRTMPGVCFRLWNEDTQSRLDKFQTPEIKTAKLSDFILQVLCWGSPLEALELMDRPSDAQLSFAYNELSLLGLVNPERQVTTLGRSVVNSGLSARIGIIFSLAKSRDLETQKNAAVLITAIDSRSSQMTNLGANLSARLQMISSGASTSLNKDRNRWLQKLSSSKQHKQKSSLTNQSLSTSDYCLSTLLCQAFKDQIGMLVGANQYLLVNGAVVFVRSSKYKEAQSILPKWLVCCDAYVSDAGDSVMSLYYSLDENFINDYLNHNKQTIRTILWDEENKKVIQRKETRLHEILLESLPQKLEYNDASASALCKHIPYEVFENLALTGKSGRLLWRALHFFDLISDSVSLTKPLPSVSEMYETREQWLSIYLQRFDKLDDLTKLDWNDIFSAEALASSLSWSEQQKLHDLLPETYTCPLGHKHSLHYCEDGRVELKIRMQSLFGLASHPTIAAGKLPITLSILSPAMREIQKTNDLPVFWKGSYEAVKKEMKGRYPKHFWPDDPETAKATSKTKAKML